MDISRMCEDKFWDWNLTWGNHRPYPEFTECFQKTVILWLPSILLYLSAPLYLYCVTQFVDVRTTRSWKYWTKISVIIAQLSVRYLQLQPEEPWTIRYTGLVVEALAMMLLIFYTDLERRKAFVTSGIQTTYWLLTSICGLLLLYSMMMRQDYNGGATEIRLHKSFLTLSIGQFVLTWFPDVHQETYSETDCKLANASFVQRLLFIWFNGFMSIGKKRPLEQGDLSDLMPSEQTEVASVIFENTWNAEKARREQTHSEPHSKPQVDLFKVLIASNFVLILVPNILKVFAVAFQLLNPIMAGILVGFAYDTEQPLWKGYVYVTLGVLSLFFDRLLNNYIDHLSVGTAVRVDACLKHFVLKKAMKLSNKARAESTTGEISSILAIDCDQVKRFIAFLWRLWCVPCVFVLSFIVLFSTVSYAAFASLAILAIVMPLNLESAKRIHKTHLQLLNKKDTRIKLMTEILNGIKILKLYAWEVAFGGRLLDIRDEELSLIRKLRMFGISLNICYHVAPFMMGLGTFALYVYISQDHMLSPKAAFQSLATFGVLTHTFNALPHLVQNFIRSFGSMRRVQNLLNCDELDESSVSHEESRDAIQIEDGTFTWDEKLGPCLKEINVSVPKGGLVAIVGSVGSGKSSLLSAILGEIDKDEGTVNVDGEIAYVSQQAWILNDTLQNNILFRKKYQETIYNNVIDACSLRRDLDILVAKDQTEIGEKGINLSGGQKQRVNIARAVYFNTDIYLLDDPLSAVDSHVGKDIFEHVISENGLLKNKTRVLVTHGITWLPRMDKIICVEGGRVTESGTYNELIANEGAFSKFIQRHRHNGNQSDTSDDEENTVQTDDMKYMPLHERTGVDNILDLLSVAESNQQIPLVLNSDTDLDSCCSTDLWDETKRNKSKRFARSISESFAVESKRENDHSMNPRQKLLRLKSFDNKFIQNKKRILKEEEKIKEGRLVAEDELETGEVKLKYITPYLEAVGTWVLALVVIFFTLLRLCQDGKSYWVKQWTSDESLSNLTTTSSDSKLRADQNAYYITVYMFIALLHCVTSLTLEVLIGFGIYRGGKVMHANMLKNILRGPMSFFDSTPVGRIVNRLSADLDPLDGSIADQSKRILDGFYGLVAAFVVLFTSIPKFSVIIVPLLYLNYEIKKQYMPIVRQLSRLKSKYRAPYFSQVAEILNGVHVIRAYGMTENFTQQVADKYTSYSQARYHTESAIRWLEARLNLISVLSFALSAFIAITNREYLGAATVGILISYALDMRENVECIVKMSGEMEHSVVCIERIGQYCLSEQEAPLHTSVVPEKSWPEKGKVEIDDYSLRYREGHELVLKDINIKVKPGEKVGIVGRTGAGKSSLTLGLFRIIEPATGKITIDKHDVSQLGLFDLRSNLTILPQEPVLFSGTLRGNLDPMNAFADEDIFNALEHAHLKSFIDSLPDKLNYECGEGGQNLSVGQRQLICLARSLLRKSHVLILDEATAAVDMETDSLIQDTIKREFKECTVLTIAHRLNTIVDYDRVMVLDHGNVKEFDSPKVLLEDKNSAFYSMARDAGLVG